MPAKARTTRNTATRERILEAAERLFAERGLFAVSNRQVAEAAGQGNTAVVGYHFGGKTDLVRAVAARHNAVIEDGRLRMLEAARGSGDIRDWVECLVRPTADHLAVLGSPTWFARFSAQIDTDPVLREAVSAEALTSPALQQTLDGLHGCLPSMPLDVRRERGAATRLLIVHAFAERERALAVGAETWRGTWAEAAIGLADTIVGVWLAPVTAPAAGA